MAPIRTTCPYCGVGCGIAARVTAERTITLKGDKQHPANAGRLCSKGTWLSETVGLEGRLLYPSVGDQRVTWNTALDDVADRMRGTIAQHGPDSVAFYVSGQLLTEDYYVANKLAKGFIGTGNIDTNSRLCMASAVAAPLAKTWCRVPTAILTRRTSSCSSARTPHGATRLYGKESKQRARPGGPSWW